MKNVKDYSATLTAGIKKHLTSKKLRLFLTLLILGWGEIIWPEPSFAQMIKATNTPNWGVEIIGIVAGFGTTFSSVPDLILMLRRRSTQGMNPRMAGICAVFQCLWLLYGFLLPSPSLIFWNIIAITTNSTTVAAYFYFAKLNANITQKNLES